MKLGFRNLYFFLYRLCPIALVLFIVSPTFVYAVGTGGSATVSGNNPSLGTMLAAALETAGYQAQAQTLSSLKGMLTELGALIYLGVIISALITLALSGHYRAAVWIIIGPGIFYFLLNTTTRASGAEWQFGAFNDRQRSNDLERVLRGSNVQINGEVSYVFHLYNVLISETMQYLIGVVTNQNMLNQMRFMSRQRVLDDLFGLDLDNAGLQSLVQFFYAHCNQEIGYATMIAMGNNEQRRIARTNANYLGFLSSPEYQSAVAHYCERFPARDKPFPPGPWQQYVTSPPPAGLGESPNPDVPVADFRSGRVTHATVSCAQLWRWTVMGARRHVGAHTEILRRTDVDPYGERVYGSAFWDNLLRDVGARVGGLGEGRNLDPCPNVAERFSDAVTNTAVHRFFSAMLIRDQLVRDPRGMMMEQFVEHGRLTVERHGAVPGSDPNRKEEILRRLRAQELAESQKYEALWLLMAMPYLQGLILYALAATFPFFAMMVLLPGQAGAFFMWMAIWAWAKSWDLGWALVMVADNVLWELMPRVSYYDFPATNAAASSEFDTPVNMLGGMFSGDHSYSLAAYWMLLSLMIGAVPVLTAQAVMGSKKAIAGVLIDGLRAMGSKLGSTAADWIAHEQIERNDVRTVREGVNSVRRTADGWFDAYRREMQRYDDLYGGGLFGRLVWRPAVVTSTTLNFAYLGGLDTIDMISPRWMGGQVGTDIENFRIDFCRNFEAHIGVPIANLAIGVNRNVVRPVLREAPVVATDVVNWTNRHPGRWANNTGRFAYNWTAGWFTGDFEYLGTQDMAQIDRNVVRAVSSVVTNVVAPDYSDRVPQQWRNLNAGDLRALANRAEADAVEARRRLMTGLEGIANQIGQMEFELRRRLEGLREELGRSTGVDMYGVILGVTPEGRMGAMARIYWGRTPDNEIERTMLFGMGRSMADNMRGMNARPEIDEAMVEIERLRMRAYLYGCGAEVTAVGSVAVGATVGYFNPALGITIGLAGLHAAYQINSTSIDMHRVAHSRTADLLALNGEAWLYDAMNTGDWYFSQEIRAGISLRGEWWNVPENPYTVTGNANALAARVRTEAANMEGGILGDVTWSVIFGVTKGKAIPASM